MPTTRLEGARADMNYLTTQEIRNELIEVLTSFDEFCRIHELRYSLYAGTLLGAVRHGGFIPWDDDLDVCMPRPDYIELLSLAASIPNGYGLVLPESDGYSCPFCKYVNLGIAAQEPISAGVYEGRLWMDIFPVDGAPSRENERQKNQEKFCRMQMLSDWSFYGAAEEDGKIKGMVKNLGCVLLDEKRAKRHMMSYLERLSITPGYDKATYVTSYAAGLTKSWALPKGDYESSVLLEFEGRQFPAMSCWDAGLRQWYGDYMVLPPESARVTHSYKAWRID